LPDGGAPVLYSLIAEYDSLGNLRRRSDVGTYSYGLSRPHAVLALAPDLPEGSFRYDDRGNQVRRGGERRAFDAQDLMKRLEDGDGNVYRFRYDAFGIRAASTATLTDGTTISIVHSGPEYQRTVERSGGEPRVSHVYRLYIEDQPVAQLTWPGADTPQIHYLHQDTSGSVSVITDGLGNVLERRSFDAFGQRRSSDWRDRAPTSFDSYPGYLGHVTDAEGRLGFVHMGTRLYDVRMGQFPSPDPVVSPGYSQDLNAYSYAWNNPLSYWDPTGACEAWIDDAGGGYCVDRGVRERLAGCSRKPRG
jgi:RHS repeat-associated protein